MEPAPGCSLKDVKWSAAAVPLDLLVSTYRLPQIARLDSGECAGARSAAGAGTARPCGGRRRLASGPAPLQVETGRAVLARRSCLGQADPKEFSRATFSQNSCARGTFIPVPPSPPPRQPPIAGGELPGDPREESRPPAFCSPSGSLAALEGIQGRV